MREFVPRAPQRLMLDFMASTPRCNLWAGMGIGKTSTCLTWLNIVYNVLGDDHPTLVLAPLRVAQSTWPDEVRKWRHLQGLEVVSCTGTPADREAALRRGAPVVCMNYDNLVWLREWYSTNGKAWPYRRVVADESTRLKSFRLRQGGVRAQALGKVAHTDVREWVNLTGTPSPNGLDDLWGQQWFIDAGQRLGRTYSAFQSRWFTPVNMGGFTSWKPAAHAQAQIQERLADCSLTVDPHDFFDLKQPIVNVIEVELPRNARAKYRELEREMFAQLASGEEVEVFNAAALSLKCLAAGTEVLTNAGWLAVENVTDKHLLWDGVEWVSSLGSVFSGYKTTVECWGVRMTPDHRVLTTSGWKQAQEVLHGESAEGFERHDVRLPDSGRPARVNNLDEEAPSHLASALRLWGPSGAGSGIADIEHQGREEVLWLQAPRDALERLEQPRHDGAPGVGYVATDAAAVHQPRKQRLEKLRRAWRHGVQAVGRLVRGLLGRHGPDLGAGPDTRPEKQRCGLHQAQLPVGNCGAAEQQHSREPVVDYPRRPHDRGAGIEALRDKACHALRQVEQGVHRGGVDCKAPVFDILNCGPRQRFTIRNTQGLAFLSHNCLQLANGAVYLDPQRYGPDKAVEVHDAKIQALSSIVEEAAGAPVLVAYHFKSDLARLQRAFPGGRTLDADPGTIAAWNSGRVPILFAHPASAGHGLNLQDGGNILVFFGQWWDLEQHDQIVERIGPMRQMQSGHDRPVFIHYIVAKGTVDELMMARRESKRSVQDLLLESMKGKTQ